MYAVKVGLEGMSRTAGSHAFGRKDSCPRTADDVGLLQLSAKAAFKGGVQGSGVGVQGLGCRDLGVGQG